MIDLHTHSTASDGTLAPADLVALAAGEGLSALALTDHDTVAGLDEARDACAAHGIVFVPGIELEIDWQPGVFHLLGLGLREWSGRLRRRLEIVAEYRTERNLRMVERMQKAGIDINYEELLKRAGHQTVGRPHFAAALTHKGIVNNVQDAFDRLIGDGKPFYERKKALDVGKACAAIHAAGGRAVVAHPHTLQIGWEELQKRLHRWKHEGVDGIEAYNPNVSLADGHRYAALAAELHLIVTAGSDFHGPGVSGRRLGYASEGTPIDVRFLEPFAEAA
jgi:predicted metal-dependent phosphoesterase TrpH